MTPTRAPGGLSFDVVSLIEHSSPPMLVLCVLLIAASLGVWFTAIVKFRQLARLQRTESSLRAEIQNETRFGSTDIPALLARHPGSIAGELLRNFALRDHAEDLIDSETDYLLAVQQKRVFSGLTLLASTASVAPLAGLFGTVYGIMEAFAWIGVAKSASLEIVAPAIGDALITTILGLFAAIPAVVAYNVLSKNGEQLIDETRAFARAWLRRAAHPVR